MAQHSTTNGTTNGKAHDQRPAPEWVLSTVLHRDTLTMLSAQLASCADSPWLRECVAAALASAAGRPIPAAALHSAFEDAAARIVDTRDLRALAAALRLGGSATVRMVATQITDWARGRGPAAAQANVYRAAPAAGPVPFGYEAPPAPPAD